MSSEKLSQDATPTGSRSSDHHYRPPIWLIIACALVWAAIIGATLKTCSPA